jgi:hypothetical protein
MTESACARIQNQHISFFGRGGVTFTLVASDVCIPPKWKLNGKYKSLTGNTIWIPGSLVNELVGRLGSIHEIGIVFIREAIILVIAGRHRGQQKGTQDTHHSVCGPENRENMIKSRCFRGYIHTV